jgi:hypothetical protein
VAQSGGNLPYASIKTSASFADFALNVENTNSTSGQGLGLRIVSGSTASDLPLYVRDRTNATTLFSVGGTGAATFAGDVKIGSAAAPTYGTAGKLYVYGGPARLNLNGADSTWIKGLTLTPTGDNFRHVHQYAWSNTGNSVATKWVKEINGTETDMMTLTDGNFAVAGSVTTGGNLTLPAAPAASNRYILTGTNNTGTGQLTIQAGGGSTGWGGNLNLFETAHATKGGWVGVGLGVAGAKFTVNSAGFSESGEVASIDRTGAATFAGQVTISSAAPYQLLTATTGTNYAYTEYVNTGNNLRIGLENSAGASIVPGAPAYAAFVASVGARSLVFATNNIVRQTIDSAGSISFSGSVTTSGVIGIGTSAIAGIGLSQGGDPGTFIFSNPNAWIGGRFAPERAATTGNAFAVSGQIRVSSGTQTRGATFMADLPGGAGTITNHTYFYANGAGDRLVPNGSYSFYADSAAGPAYIGSTTPSTGVGFGALQVAGGIYVGAASVFAGDVAFNVGRNTVGDAFYSYSTNVFTFGSGNAAQSARIFSGGNAALTFDTSRGATFAGTVTTLGRILAIGTIRTAAYTVTTSDHVVVCNNATTPFTVTMIAASSNTGRQFIIKNKGVATITVDATSLGTIDGSNTMTLTTNQAATLVSDGVQWNRI